MWTRRLTTGLAVVLNQYQLSHDLNAYHDVGGSACNTYRQIEKKILDKILGKMVYDSRIRYSSVMPWSNYHIIEFCCKGPQERMRQALPLLSL